MRRIWLAVAVVLSLCAIAGGGLTGASWLFETEEKVSFTVAQPVERIAVEGNADVDVMASIRPSIAVERTTLYFLDEPASGGRSPRASRGSAGTIVRRGRWSPARSTATSASPAGGVGEPMVPH